MGFGSLVRSLSDARKRSSYQPTHSSNHHEQRRASRHRRHSSVGGRANQITDPSALYYHALRTYEDEENAIMRDELRKRGRNQKELERQMDMLERRKHAESSRIQEALFIDHDVADAMYRSGKIDGRKLSKLKREQKDKADKQWNKFFKQYEADKAKAHRVFHARGEELCADAGAALRRAKDKFEAAAGTPYQRQGRGLI